MKATRIMAWAAFFSALLFAPPVLAQPIGIVRLGTATRLASVLGVAKHFRLSWNAC